MWEKQKVPAHPAVDEGRDSAIRFMFLNFSC